MYWSVGTKSFIAEATRVKYCQKTSNFYDLFFFASSKQILSRLLRKIKSGKIEKKEERKIYWFWKFLETCCKDVEAENKTGLRWKKKSFFHQILKQEPWWHWRMWQTVGLWILDALIRIPRKLTCSFLFPQITKIRYWLDDSELFYTIDYRPLVTLTLREAWCPYLCISENVCLKKF